MRRVYLAFAFALVCVLSGCSISDPTENEFAPSFINDTASTATIAYCKGSSSCAESWWMETLRPDERTANSINAGRGNLSVFLIRDHGRRLCIRIARYVKTIRLSSATADACHAPYD